MKKNKKIFIIAVLFAMVLPLANPAQAATARELQSQIAALLAQIQTLRQQLTQLQGGTTTWCHTFNKNLRYGDEGMEVGALIKALQLQGFNYSYNEYSAPFDDVVASAVVQFQEKYASEILSPYGLKRGTGYVGPSTRAKLNALYGCGTTPPTTQLVITSLGTINALPGEQVAAYVSNLPANPSSYKYGILFSGQTTGGDVNATLSSNGTYLGFTVPTLPAGNYNIKVFVFGSGINSNSVPFTIGTPSTQPTITVTSPNGGSFPAGSNITVTWNRTGNMPANIFYFVYLKPKPDQVLGGTTTPITYTPLIFRAEILGYPSFNVTLPTSPITPGIYYLELDLADASGIPFASSTSNAFTITSSTSTKPSITVTSPTGGEQWNIGTYHEIDWIYSPLPPNDFQIELVAVDGMRWVIRSFGDGSTYYQGTSSEPNNYNKFHINWRVGYNNQGAALGNFPAGRYKVEVANRAYDGSVEVAGLSANYFTISSQPTISVSSISLDASNNVHFSFSQQAGACLQLKDSQGNYFSLNSSRYSYSCANTTLFNGYQTELTIPKSSFTRTIVVGQYYRVCNYDTRGNAYAVCSNPVLVTSSTQPSITVTSPNGGEQWAQGVGHNITWTSNGIDKVYIYWVTYYASGAQSNNGLIASNVLASAGSYFWSVPSIFTANHRNEERMKILISPVKYSLIKSTTPTDFSDNYFSIFKPLVSPSITVYSPYQGVTWQNGSTQIIVWASNYVDVVNISLDLGSAGTFPIASNIKAADYSYSWTIPDNIPASTRAKVVISSGSLSARSPNFTIAPPSDSAFNPSIQDNLASIAKALQQILQQVSQLLGQ